MARRGSGEIKPEILQALVKVSVEAKQQSADIAAEVARDRKAAVDDHGLHPRAFSLCVTLSRMDQVKRLAFLQALDSYRHILSLDDAPQIEAFEDHQAQRAA